MNTCVIVSLLVIAVAVSANDKRQLIGICVEECSLTATKSPILRAFGIGGCPDGYSCKTNGCGHVCVKDDISATNCPDVLCAMYCENGFQTDINGCPVCRCQEKTMTIQ